MKKLLIILVVICLVAFAAYKFLYKEHRDITSEDAVFTTTVTQLAGDFGRDANAASAKYADKTLSVSGNITQVDQASKTIMVDGKLSATSNEEITAKQGDAVVVKGRFVGYDDLLEEMKMDQVTIKNQ